MSRHGMIKDVEPMVPLDDPERWENSPIQCILARMAPRASGAPMDADEKFLLARSQRAKLGPRPPSTLLGVLNPDLPGNYVIRCAGTFTWVRNLVSFWAGNGLRVHGIRNILFMLVCLW